jgi:hypothetical protein
MVLVTALLKNKDVIAGLSDESDSMTHPSQAK